VNVDEILRILHAENVYCLLIGGMNFLLRHLPELTFDVDLLFNQDMLRSQEILPAEIIQMSAENDLKSSEERKREAAHDPVERWRHIQQTITWAEANLPPEQRRNRPHQPRRAAQSHEKAEL